MKSLETLFSYIAVTELSLSAMLLYILFLINRNHRANIFLGLFIISISMPFAASLIIRLNLFWSGLVFCLSVAFTTVSGAFIYLYMCILSGDIGEIRKRVLVHFVPFPAMFLTTLLLHNSGKAGSGHGTPSAGITACIIISVIIPTVYIVFTFIKIRSYSVKIENWFSDTEKVSMHWLKKITVISLFLFLQWGCGFIITTFHIISWNPFLLLPHILLIAVVNLVTTYYVIRQPEIFKANREMNELLSAVPANIETPAKYAKQSINKKTQKQYLDKLIHCMEIQKPFLDEDVTIRSIAEITSIPVHHISIVINSLLNKNFTTFINEYRISEARKLLDSDKEANILSVAFMTGFSSKSSFNTAFKKITGKTPSDYRDMRKSA